mgnify:FL=1|tara:strand:+ start:4415 stop:4774 length:360 start_codon:yes stop_codon:yes gene_type:complete
MTTKINEARMNAVWDNMTVEAHTRLYAMYQGYTHTLECMCRDSGCKGVFSLSHMNDCEYVPFQFKDWIKLNLYDLTRTLEAGGIALTRTLYHVDLTKSFVTYDADELTESGFNWVEPNF